MEENEKLRARVNTLSDSCLAYHHANAGLKTERDQLKAEVDRLTKEKKELMDALENQGKLLIMTSIEVQRTEIHRYLSGGYKEKIESAVFHDSLGIQSLLTRIK